MVNRILELLKKEGIELFGILPLKSCKITKQYLLNKTGISSGFVVIFAIPYYTHACDSRERNISSYAVGRDYHFFVKELEKKLLPILKNEFPLTSFAIFADHSPIDERDAAARSGIGTIGKNKLIITEKFSSYVFLAEIIVGETLKKEYNTEKKIPFCENCGACTEACPWRQGKINSCISALTQKKGLLTQNEAEIIRNYSIWGCDICTEVCPYTKKALASGSIYSPIEFFSVDTMPTLTYDNVSSMKDEDFQKRAYSWRGRETVIRNIEAASGERNRKIKKGDRET